MSTTSTQSLLGHLTQLRSEKLNASLEILCGFLATAIKNNSETYSPANQYEILLHQADVNFKKKHFRIAESVYRQAINVRKNGLKQNQKNVSSFNKLPSEVDVKYKIHVCCHNNDDDHNAISILESIPIKYRTVKINYALAQIHHKLGRKRSAILSYKDVLKKMPLALDVIFSLLSLGESINEILSIVSNAAQGLDWFLPLIKARAFLHCKEYYNCYSHLNILMKKTAIAGDAQVHCSLAKLRARTGNNKSAIVYFESARMNNPFLLDGMDIYAYLLYEEDEHEKLDKVACELFSITCQHPAPWVTLGYRALSKGDYKRVVYLAVQATKLDPVCVQALILKGCALRAIDEIKDATAHFREASRIDPNWFVCYKELAETQLQNGRTNEAIAVAHSALNTIGYLTSCLVLCASVHMCDQNGKDKALNYVNKALVLEANNQYAIIVKANVLYKYEKYTEGIKFLSDTVEYFSSSPMHTILGNCYQEVKNYPKAVEHYTIALSLNSNNKEASEGLNKISNQQQDINFESGSLDTGQQGVDAEEGNSDSDAMYTE
uniref:anaphase-promoting complex subunit 7-like n=1 Tax=Styela clava TaxID=7725 RepID=UPI001939EA22|nr:anaphase-promoting complex subunit 7-like [Styela clava]